MKPREKLLTFWTQKLEWWELVATILGSWIKWTNVFKMSKNVNKIIKEKKQNIKIEDLKKIKWIWKVKAIQIISAFELAKRYFENDWITINSVDDILWQVWEYRNKKREYLLCITLNWANKIISQKIITIWLINQSLIHPREIFAWAIEDRANSIILVHNHPSWINYPSNNDLKNTKRIKEVWELVWIKLLDHIIITKNNHFSFKEYSFL